MPTRLPVGLLCALIACCMNGCSSSSERPGDGSDNRTDGIVTLYVVNYPLKYFADRIGGSHVRTVFPVPQDEDPAYWQPQPEEIVEYQKADLILLNGASYAKWIRTASLPQAGLVDTSASFRERYITIDDAVTHTHGPGAEHSHGGTASTTWLDLKLAAAQAASIRDALVKLRPQHEADFLRNFKALAMDLTALDAALAQLVEGKTDRPIVFSHPVYQYLTQRYDLNARSVHWEPDEIPSAEQWDELSAMLEQHPTQWMVWEDSPAEETVSRLQQMSVQCVVFHPCGNRPPRGDFVQAMQQNLDNLRQVYAQ